MAVQTLPQFLAQTGTLTPKQRQTLIDQASVLIDDVYVHLPLKRAMHAIDPVQRLRNLRARMAPLSELEFHDELIAIFTELRDLHTNYILPEPYAGKLAFLPFLVEECDSPRRYLVTKLLAGFTHPTFGVGAQLTHLNGVPVERAVELNAARQAGSNVDARHARGLEALTIRDMSQSAPPDELWVDINYLPAGGGEAQQLRLEWNVFAPDPSPNGVDPADAMAAAARTLGYDAATENRRRAKKSLFNPAAMQLEASAAAADAATSTMPDVFSFNPVTTPDGTFGYLRIWTFMVSDEDAFLAEVVRILGLLPQNGLIVDVRGNGGGNLLCAEGMLQLFTPHTVAPTLLSLIATPLTVALSAGADGEQSGLDAWHDSLDQAAQTGSPFSQSLPILPPERFNMLGQHFQGPVVLITDALCYSATDMFAAGFRDNALGPILGTAGNTGAGGANVWTHDLLRQLFGEPFEPLPKKATFRVSFRRTTRQGAAAGTPIEDLGIVPDAVHVMTEQDVLSGNPDLLHAATRMLAALPVRQLAATLGTVSGAELPVTLKTAGIDRVDAALDGRPMMSVDVHDGTTAIRVPAPPHAAKSLDLAGFDAGVLAVRSRVAL
jgi:C-terminal processing protease CtpA/Prc